MAGQAFFSARLLAGDLPAELEQVFAAAGAPLFPASVGELTQHCGCPDFAVPCKHLAATFYLLAEAFDADPFQLLHWRGRSRDELLGRLRTLRAEAVGSPAPVDGSPVDVASGGAPGRTPVAVPSLVDGADVGSDTTVAGSARVLADLPDVPLTEAADRFWLPPVPLPDRPTILATDPELLLRQLGSPAPAIGGPGLLERLRRAYQALGPG